MNKIVFNPNTNKFCAFVDLQDEQNLPCRECDTLEEAVAEYEASQIILNGPKAVQLNKPKIIYMKTAEDRITELEKRVAKLEKAKKNNGRKR